MSLQQFVSLRVEDLVPEHCLPVSLDVGRADISRLEKLIAEGARFGNENFETDRHLDEVIPKPWGYEYRAYVDDSFDLWCLHIDPGHSTSAHVHPRKLTYLLGLGGEGVTCGLGRADVPVRPGTVLRIAGGVFHGTRNTGTEQLVLIEVEVPRNKLDLVRLRDDYDRAGKAYETLSLEEPQNLMRRVPSRQNARMRTHTTDGAYHFDLRTGMDIFYRPSPDDLFHVPLHITGVVHNDVEILTGDPADHRRPNTDRQYLCISWPR